MHAFICRSILLAIEYMNPLDTLPGYCWIQSSPPGCERDKSIECVRGEGARIFSGIVGTGSAVSTWMIVIVCMVCIFFKVRHTEQRIQRYSINTRTVTRETGYQALLYIGAFFLSYAALVIIQMLVQTKRRRENRSLYFVLSLVAQLLFPLQGKECC